MNSLSEHIRSLAQSSTTPQTLIDIAEDVQELEAENARLMEVLAPPDGWEFCSADFSSLASRRSSIGTVMFRRDIEGVKAWHALPDEQKEHEDCPPLYVSGRGASLYAALCDAGCAIRGINTTSAGVE